MNHKNNINNRQDDKVHMIRLDQITIVNPRQRGRTKFRQIVDSIAKLGLKKPITVTPKKPDADKGDYYLVCGQGRYEAFVALDEEEIPAIIVNVTKEKLLLMSLVENLARRQHSTFELLKEIESLKDQKYSVSQIAQKTALDVTYVRGVLKLMKKGEERLLHAVEHSRIPISVAVTIATSDDHAIQRALTKAYESKDLRGKRLLAARRLVEKRRNEGKTLRGGGRPRNGSAMSSKNLLKTYEEETARQRLLIHKSKLCETRLLFVVSALKQLIQDEDFVTLLRAESLDSLPSFLASQIYPNEES